MHSERDLIVYIRPRKYKKAEFSSVSLSFNHIGENMVIFVCSSPCNFVNSHAFYMAFLKIVAMYTIQKFFEYHDYAVNTFRVIAFHT